VSQVGASVPGVGAGCTTWDSTDRLDWFAFLVHDRTCGVPATDDRSYIHVRLALRDAEDLALGAPWEMTRRQALPSEIAGVDAAALAGGAGTAWRILGEQSALFLSILERCTDPSPVQHVRQFLHFFANMAQMRVV
jgi:hypothetical protein